MSSNVVLFLSAEPCITTAADMRQRNIALKYKSEQKVYTPHNDRLEFACRHGRPVDWNMVRYCYDGVMDLPTCY